jgi:hypothetical protein
MTWGLAIVLLLGTPALAQPRIVAALGKAKVQGQDVMVEVFVVVRPGQNGRDVARAALAAQGATPVEDAAFTTNGLLWDRFPIIQNYNPANESVPTGQAALEATHATWNGVAASAAEILTGGITNRCPSLVQECPGRQRFDGNNDVAWVRIGGCCTLGVTWFGTTVDEADMALNTSFSWADDGVSHFDVETVFLHENGHVLGLGHSPVAGAVMEATYAGVRDTLHPDDEAGIIFLYPAGTTTTLMPTTTTTATPVTSTTTTTLQGCAPRNAACSTAGECCSGKCKNGTCRGE